MAPWLSVLRPHQWIKNVLVALPAVVAHRWNEPRVLAVFVGFCLTASCVYILNDLVDRPADRKHPTKKKRVIASGAISETLAAVTGPWLIIPSVLLAIFFGFLVSLMAYLILSIFYCLWLKRIMMLDVVVLASLYGLRVAAGAEATGIPLSHWLVGFCLFLFLCLAMVKRVNDIRPPYRSYNLETMSGLMTASALASVVMFTLYLNDVPPLYSHPQLLWGNAVLLVFWLGRMCLVGGADPMVFAVTDRTSLVTGAAAVAIFWAAI